MEVRRTSSPLLKLADRKATGGRGTEPFLTRLTDATDESCVSIRPFEPEKASIY